jgi:hypothetical protein
MTITPTALLSLPLITTGTESGDWGNDVNNGLTAYLDNAIAGTVTLTNDGAVTLSNTAGTNLATNIVSSLTGAGSVSAQFAIIRVTGTLTTAKVLTAPSLSKTYVVANTATGSTVTIKASGQTGVSIAVGEVALVYYNGTDYVKAASSLITALTGTLSVSNGGTGATTLTGVVIGNGTSAFTVVTAPSGTIVGTTDTQTLTNKTLTSPTSTNGTFTNPTVTGYVESVVTSSASGTATIALGSGTVQVITLSASTTFTMPTATAGTSFIVLLKQTGAYTATFSGVKWSGLGAPTITATAGKMDILTFVSDGTNWYGSYVQGYTP